MKYHDSEEKEEDYWEMDSSEFLYEKLIEERKLVEIYQRKKWEKIIIYTTVSIVALVFLLILGVICYESLDSIKSWATD